MTDNWMDDPALAEIDRGKLAFLQSLLFESRSLTREQMLPFLMAAVRKSKDSHISFDSGEVKTITSVIRRYAAPEELSRLDSLLKTGGR